MYKVTSLYFDVRLGEVLTEPFGEIEGPKQFKLNNL